MFVKLKTSCSNTNPIFLIDTGAEWAWQIFFLGQSISFDETNAFFLRGLWALEWALHIRKTNLRCVQGYGI